MTKVLKRPLSVLLAALMVISLFAVVPISASAAEETSTVTWNSFSGTGGMSSGGVTLTTQQAKTRVGENFYKGRGSATFTAPEGSVFTKIELKNCTVVDSLNFPGATVAQTGGYWQQEPWDDEPNWVQYYTVTWTGESSEVTFSGAIYGIQSIVFTLKSVAPPTYTVTWKNGETTLKTDTVDKDAIPAYSGDVPTKAEDANNTYTFSGWSDGTTTYGLSDTLPNVTADATYTATFTAVPKVINYDGEYTLNPNDRITVSDEDEGKKKFDLKLNQYLNMQMLGIQKKSAIATQGGDDGIRFVTAVNSNLLKGNKIKDYGYIVVKAKEGTPVADIYSKMDNLTYDKVANSSKNFFSCYGSDNTISGDFGKFSTNTDYKYVTLALTGTSGSSDTVAARFYVQTTDGEYHYAKYVKGNDTYGGMAFKLSDVADKLG